MKPITIVIADDHRLVREALTMVLKADQRFEVLASYSTAEAAIEAVRKFAPNVVLLDINLPSMNGVKAVPLILKASPSSQIIGISLHAQPSYARKMVQVGASGYVTKNSSKAEMIEAIVAVNEGRKFICSQIKEAIAEQFTEEQDSNKSEKLSGRELEIIDLIKKGMSSREIGESLLIATKTVEVHRYNILKKLDLKNSAALINFLNTR